MSFELAPGTLLNNRYQIKKVIVFGEDGGVYLARDMKVTDSNWIVKEIIPHSSLDDTALASRKELYLEAVESIMQWDHPALPRILDNFTEAKREYIIMEEVVGVTLQNLCDMSVNALPEKQILGWSMQLCDALIYLHNRPKPFVFEALSPAHIILTSDEHIKLINYGLDAIFGEQPPPTLFSDAANEILKEFSRFGETIGFLLCKEKMGPYGLPNTANVSPELAKVINRCLQGESQKTYANFEDLKKDLDLVIHPPATPTAKKGKTAKQKPISEIDWSPITDRVIGVLNKFLSQRPVFLYTEGTTFLVLIIGLFLYARAGANYLKAGTVAYLATTKDQLYTVDVATKKVVDHRPLQAQITDMVADPNGRWLFISDYRGDRVVRLDAQTNTVMEKGGSIKVDRAPSRMLIDDSGRRLYVVHESTNNVSSVDLQRDPPMMDKVIAVGNLPRYIALGPASRVLCASNAHDQSVTMVDPETTKSLGTVQVSGIPGALAISPDGSSVWVTCTSPDQVVAIDIASSRVTDTIPDTGGTRPTSIVFSQDGAKVYVVNNGSSNVGVIDVSTHKLIKTIATEHDPQRIIYTPYQDKLWVTCADQVTCINATTDSKSESFAIPVPLSGAETMAK